MSFCERMRLRARPLWKDDKDLALFELIVGSFDGAAIALTTFNRESTQEADQPTKSAIERFLFRHIDNCIGETLDHHGNICPGDMIGGNDEGTLTRYVMETANTKTCNNGEYGNN